MLWCYHKNGHVIEKFLLCNLLYSKKLTHAYRRIDVAFMYHETQANLIAKIQHYRTQNFEALRKSLVLDDFCEDLVPLRIMSPRKDLLEFIRERIRKDRFQKSLANSSPKMCCLQLCSNV